MNEGGERTERATPKKRRDARERGQVLKSTEVNTAFCAIIMFALMLIFWPSITDQIIDLYYQYLGSAIDSSVNGTININLVQKLLTQAILSMTTIVLPIVACAFVTGLFINIIQVGFLFTTKTLQPKFERISILKGFKRIFSVRTLTELIKSMIKIVALGYILYSEYMRMLPHFPAYIQTDIYNAVLEIMRSAFMTAIKMCIALGIIAAFDYMFQWWKHEKDLRMTKQEVKDEYKLTEGDPQIKNKIKQKQRQMSAMRMMEKVPSADVVITNPTHFAVALKYEDGNSRAPVVIAKGQDFVALKIKEIAREHKVEIVENKPLAQALYAICDLDDEIPEEFYQAVADILVYVYKQKNPEHFRRKTVTQ